MSICESKFMSSTKGGLCFSRLIDSELLNEISKFKSIKILAFQSKVSNWNFQIDWRFRENFVKTGALKRRTDFCRFTQENWSILRQTFCLQNSEGRRIINWILQIERETNFYRLSTSERQAIQSAPDNWTGSLNGKLPIGNNRQLAGALALGALLLYVTS